MKIEFPVELGAIARDKITGFTGVVVCVGQWLNGCQRVTLQPQQLKDGAVIATDTFDSQQIETISTEPVLAARPVSGGPCPEPKRSPNPQ